MEVQSTIIDGLAKKNMLWQTKKKRKLRLSCKRTTKFDPDVVINQTRHLHLLILTASSIFMLVMKRSMLVRSS